MYGHTFSKSMDQPVKVASPARGQQNGKNENFPVRVSMYGGDCDAATAKAAATVTHVHSQSRDAGSGDEDLGFLCFDLSSAETDFWWLEDEQ